MSLSGNPGYCVPAERGHSIPDLSLNYVTI